MRFTALAVLVLYINMGWSHVSLLYYYEKIISFIHPSICSFFLSFFCVLFYDNIIITLAVYPHLPMIIVQSYEFKGASHFSRTNCFSAV